MSGNEILHGDGVLVSGFGYWFESIRFAPFTVHYIYHLADGRCTASLHAE